jgi:DNA-directed RNA polymerase alpha subunit
MEFLVGRGSGIVKPTLISESQSLTDRYGLFSAQPFERGLGTTIGNCLRRTLLSLIEGAAITAIRIEGVFHEFSSIPGVVEDATDIILNLKRVPIKVRNGQPKILRVERAVQGEILSGDILADNEVEIVDPKVHIATVLDGGSLSIEMRVKCGRGHVSAEHNYDEDLAVGYIPVDSVHSPVKKVTYNVESARLGQDIDYDKLTIEVWTNGTVRPDDALSLAGKVIDEQIQIFIALQRASYPAKTIARSESENPEYPTDFEDDDVPWFFQGDNESALRSQVEWAMERLELNDQFFSNFLGIGVGALQQWRREGMTLSQDSQNDLKEFWQMILHLLSYLSFDFGLVQRVLNNRDERVSRSPFDPPWIGTSIKQYLEASGPSGISDVNGWVLSFRFADRHQIDIENTACR